MSAGLTKTLSRVYVTQKSGGLPLKPRDIHTQVGRKSERPATSEPANRTVQCLPPRSSVAPISAEARTNERKSPPLSHLSRSPSRLRPSPMLSLLSLFSFGPPPYVRERTVDGDLQFRTAECRSTWRLLAWSAAARLARVIRHRMGERERPERLKG